MNHVGPWQPLIHSYKNSQALTITGWKINLGTISFLRNLRCKRTRNSWWNTGSRLGVSPHTVLGGQDKCRRSSSSWGRKAEEEVSESWDRQNFSMQSWGNGIPDWGDSLSKGSEAWDGGQGKPSWMCGRNRSAMSTEARKASSSQNGETLEAGKGVQTEFW